MMWNVLKGLGSEEPPADDLNAGESMIRFMLSGL